MALPINIFVGSSKEWIPDMIAKAKKLRLGPGEDPKTDIAPLQNKGLKDRVLFYINKAIEEGSELLLDGRNPVVPGFEKGNFIAPTILGNVKTSMVSYQEELFGPVA
jgi:malonate-semialdehyde dehydrogenase (acetylating)/methylmalonate-semialdehyde dehydrogenase